LGQDFAGFVYFQADLAQYSPKFSKFLNPILPQFLRRLLPQLDLRFDQEGPYS
jgi:hypothetical protein